MIVFSKNEIRGLLSHLDIKTKKMQEKEFVLDENNDVAACPVCGKDITTDKVGNIAKGSKIVFCDNPACFASHLAKQT